MGDLDPIRIDGIEDCPFTLKDISYPSLRNWLTTLDWEVSGQSDGLLTKDEFLMAQERGLRGITKETVPDFSTFKSRLSQQCWRECDVPVGEDGRCRRDKTSVLRVPPPSVKKLKVLHPRPRPPVSIPAADLPSLPQWSPPDPLVPANSQQDISITGGNSGEGEGDDGIGVDRIIRNVLGNQYGTKKGVDIVFVISNNIDYEVAWAYTELEGYKLCFSSLVPEGFFSPHVKDDLIKGAEKILTDLHQRGFSDIRFGAVITTNDEGWFADPIHLMTLTTMDQDGMEAFLGFLSSTGEGKKDWGISPVSLGVQEALQELTDQSGAENRSRQIVLLTGSAQLIYEKGLIARSGDDTPRVIDLIKLGQKSGVETTLIERNDVLLHRWSWGPYYGEGRSALDDINIGHEFIAHRAYTERLAKIYASRYRRDDASLRQLRDEILNEDGERSKLLSNAQGRAELLFEIGSSLIQLGFRDEGVSLLRNLISSESFHSASRFSAALKAARLLAQLGDRAGKRALASVARELPGTVSRDARIMSESGWLNDGMAQVQASAALAPFDRHAAIANLREIAGKPHDTNIRYRAARKLMDLGDFLHGGAHLRDMAASNYQHDYRGFDGLYEDYNRIAAASALAAHGDERYLRASWCNRTAFDPFETRDRCIEVSTLDSVESAGFMAEAGEYLPVSYQEFKDPRQDYYRIYRYPQIRGYHSVIQKISQEAFKIDPKKRDFVTNLLIRILVQFHLESPQKILGGAQKLGEMVKDNPDPSLTLLALGRFAPAVRNRNIDDLKSYLPLIDSIRESVSDPEKRDWVLWKVGRYMQMRHSLEEAVSYKDWVLSDLSSSTRSTMAYTEFFPKLPALQINKSPLHYYTDVDRDEGEEQLRLLSLIPSTRESWAYSEFVEVDTHKERKKNRWLEMGILESTGNVSNSPLLLFLDYFSGQPYLNIQKLHQASIYYLHPISKNGHFVRSPITPEELRAVLTTYNTVNTTGTFHRDPLRPFDGRVVTPLGEYIVAPKRPVDDKEIEKIVRDYEIWLRDANNSVLFEQDLLEGLNKSGLIEATYIPHYPTMTRVQESYRTLMDLGRNLTHENGTTLSLDDLHALQDKWLEHDRNFLNAIRDAVKELPQEGKKLLQFYVNERGKVLSFRHFLKTTMNSVQVTQ